MNGAQAIVRTLERTGVDTCFANPGTSEIHLLAALAESPAQQTVLCLFEGVATGAADGYGRMADRAATALLHLGPGLSNGLANLHNARRAATPLLAIVGDHAIGHKAYNPPLQTDIDAIAGTVSTWVRRCKGPQTAAADAAEAVAATAGTGGTAGVATLIVPSDVAWAKDASPAPAVARQTPGHPIDSLELAVKALQSDKRCVLLLGGNALRRPELLAANRIVHATEARVFVENSPARIQRGAGIPAIPRLAYQPAAAVEQLAGAECLILVGAPPPVAFFAYPKSPSDLAPPGCETIDLGHHPHILEQLARVVAGRVRPPRLEREQPGTPSGTLDAAKAAAVIGAHLPEDAIVSDEAITSGWWLPEATATCPPHDWLTLTGGAIGQGMPVALGAAVACPERPVVNLQADGSALYTPQSLWSQSRYGLNVTTVIFNNASYAILGLELDKAFADAPGRDILALPGLDFVALARGMSVPATRVTTAEEFSTALGVSIAEPGPHLVEVMLPPATSFRHGSGSAER